MRELFVRELRTMLGRERDRDDLRRVFAFLGEPDVPLERSAAAGLATGDERELATLACVLREEALDAASYRYLARLAEALEVDGDVVRLLRLLLERHAYAAEQAENRLAERLAELYVPKMPTL